MRLIEAKVLTSYVDTLYSEAATALGEMIRKSGSNPRYYAFNPLSWTRTDTVDLPYSGATVHVIEVETGQEVPSQIVSVGGQQKLRILVRDIPAVGYKVYEVVPGAGSAFPNAATITDEGANKIIENAYYQLTVSPRGAIIHLIDKTRNNKDFAQTISGRAINDLGAGSGSFQVENVGPASATIVVSATAPLSHTTRITVFGESNRIDINNEITKNFTNQDFRLD